MELDWLHTYLAVLDHGGFTAAAEHLHRSQSRVSAHVAALEQEFGVRLVDRTRRPPSPTEAGVAFAEHARAILTEVGWARSAMDARRSTRAHSEVRMITTPSIAAALVPILVRMSADFPAVRFRISECGWAAVSDGIDDATLLVLPGEAAGELAHLRAQTLWSEPLLALVPRDHDIARADRPVTPTRLAAEDIALLAPGFADSDGLPFPARFLLDTPTALVAAVRSGAGIGVAGAVELGQVDAPDLVTVEIAPTPPARVIRMYFSDAFGHSVFGRALRRAAAAGPVPVGGYDVP